MKLLFENWRKFIKEQETPSNDFCTNYPNACKNVYGTVRANMPQIKKASDFEKSLGAAPGRGIETNEPEKIPDLGKATRAYLQSSDDRGEYPRGDQVQVNTISDVDPFDLNPTQKDLYMDNALDKVATAENPGISWNPWNASILVSEDNYILDGHHRWAATIIYNKKHPDDARTMTIEKVQLPIGPLLKISNAYCDAGGQATCEPRQSGGAAT